MEREFWQVAELEGVADIEEINRVLDRAVTLKNMLKSKDRVEAVARFVAQHFQAYVQPMGYKAFLVAVDREACCLYKEALDRHLPPEVSQVIISPGHNDPPAVKRYHLSEEQEAAVRKAFRKPDENPQILIVTEKLLTGYDAPILYAMYLDKPMRDHVLLQAIARVNRPYEDQEGRRKTSGLIVDFVGIFDNLERALAFDSQDLEGVVEDLEVLKGRFADLMARGRREFLPVSAGKEGDKAVEAVLEHFRDKKRREGFYAYFRELEEVYEILSPDPFLRPFLEDYQRLVEMYRLLRSAYEPHVPVDRSFLRKTAEIVQKHTHGRPPQEPKDTYEIGPEALLALTQAEKPDTVKVFNLLRELHRLVEAKGREAPHLIPIGERAEALRQAFEERQLSSQQALAELEGLVRQLKEAEEERRRTRLSREAFAVAWWLRVQKGWPPEEALDLAARVEDPFRSFRHWATSSAQERELRRELYKVLAKVSPKEVVAWVNELLSLLRRAAE
ncbi:type I restriction enzyme subunit R domain-containing protein [Thermus thermophilus]